MFFISPPFGNWFIFKNSKPIVGSFTLEPRPGLLGQIFRTLRYSEKHDGWVNKIGLRNDGIDAGIQKYKNCPCSVLSIAILNEEEIPKLVKKIPPHFDLEINISCPNLDKKMVSNGISKFLNPQREWCIVKMSPESTKEDIDVLYDSGFRQFHCSNTIPLGDKGGLSGSSLIPYTSNLVKMIKEEYEDVIVIAGGGVSNKEVADKYLKLGADHVSVSSAYFNPFNLLFLRF